jgi:hypothetical protein
MLILGGVWSIEDAWKVREGRKRRYNGQRLGGTIVVHFIKKHMWFFETVLALLEGEEETEDEIRRVRKEQSPSEMTVLPRTTSIPHRSQLDGRLPAMHPSGRLAVKVR